MPRISRKTLATSPSQAAPVRILLLTFPLWCLSLLLLLLMHFTGMVVSTALMLCLFILPFKARKGICPSCGLRRLFPFSGFGGACKGCGQELVLRGTEIHLLEPASQQPVAGSGRGNRPTRR